MPANFVETLKYLAKTIPTDYPSALVDTTPEASSPCQTGQTQDSTREIFFDLVKHEKLTLEGVLPPLQGTVFGLIVAGRLCHQRQSAANTHFCGFVAPTDDTLQDLLKKCWELETFPREFTHRRDDSGIYVVFLPTKPSVAQLGDSEKMARQRFNFLEKRMLRPPELRAEYSKFMNEYLRLGHRTEVEPDAACSQHNSPSYHIMQFFDPTASPRNFAWYSTHRRRQVPVCP
jgi:hypothetical protein